MTFERGTPVRGAVSALLFDAIDYAGLFPPAALDMPGAASEYASYLASTDRWALGRFVVPASRLDELALVAGNVPPTGGDSGASRDPWRLSVVFGADLPSDAARVIAFRRAQHDRQSAGEWVADVEAVEVRAKSPAEVLAIAAAVPDDLDRFIEIPATGDVASLVRAIGAANACAKIRTGGTTADAFPTSSDVARFLSACLTEGVPFKATAGLHHPVRGEYPLTYAPDSVRGTMFGFLNIFLAAAFLRADESGAVVEAILEERDPAAFRFDEDQVSWRDRSVSLDELAALRNGGIRSFGSCSFREPIDELEFLRVI